MADDDILKQLEDAKRAQEQAERKKKDGASCLKVGAWLVGGFAVLLVIGGIILFIWIQKNKDALFEGSEQSMQQGTAFGAGRQGSDCVDEAFRRQDECDGLVCEIQVGVFVRACLIEAAPSPELCADAPEEGKILPSAAWAVKQCEQRGRSGDQPCARMMQAVLESCYGAPADAGSSPPSGP